MVVLGNQEFGAHYIAFYMIVVFMPTAGLPEVAIFTNPQCRLTKIMIFIVQINKGNDIH